VGKKMKKKIAHNGRALFRGWIWKTNVWD